MFKCRFAVGQLSVNCWYTAGRQLADSIPTVGRQTFRGAVLHFYCQLSLNGHLYKMDTSVKRTLRVGPWLSLLPLFDSL